MLTVRGAAGGIDFYARAFDAAEVSRQTTPSGQVIAELSIGALDFYVVDENKASISARRRSAGRPCG
jgi:uncharacterized glyoxalase superfamily protein PhnB